MGIGVPPLPQPQLLQARPYSQSICPSGLDGCDKVPIIGATTIENAGGQHAARGRLAGFGVAQRRWRWHRCRRRWSRRKSRTCRSRPASTASASRSTTSRNIPRRRISSCSARAISRSRNARPGRRGRDAPGGEVGSGFNTVRVYDGIAYLGGYNSPPTLFGILIADVRDPKNIKPLSFIPCNPGTRCNYLRVNQEKKILIFGHDDDPRGNPNKAAGGRDDAGRACRSTTCRTRATRRSSPSFRSRRTARRTGSMPTTATSMPARSSRPSSTAKALQIIDYGNPAQHQDRSAPGTSPARCKGEQYGPLNRNGPDGKPQIIQCHEIVYYNDRVYAAWRDAGMVILDVKDRTKPKLLATYDYNPPFHGGNLGAAHTSAPVVDAPGRASRSRRAHRRDLRLPAGLRAHPRRVRPEEPGGREGRAAGQCGAALDLPLRLRVRQVRSREEARSSATATAPAAAPARPRICRGSTSARRASSTSPGTTRACARWTSPIRSRRCSSGTSCRRAPARRGRKDRHTREIFQDPDTGLLYLTDGNGGGLMVLRYTGPIPDKPPIPGGR